jgi:uncharacterized membrane protein SirB2
MNKALRITLQVLVVTSSIVLITGTMFHFEKKNSEWQTYRVILLAICAIGYISFLIYTFKTGNKEKFRMIIIAGALLLLASALFYFIG